MQNKAVSLRPGNKALCHNCYPPCMNTSILGCSISLHHCTTVKETFLSRITVQQQVQCVSNSRGCSSSIFKFCYHKDNSTVLRDSALIYGHTNCIKVYAEHNYRANADAPGTV